MFCSADGGGKPPPYFLLIILDPASESKRKLPAPKAGQMLFVKSVQNWLLKTAEMHKESAPSGETLAGMRLASGAGRCYDKHAEKGKIFG